MGWGAACWRYRSRQTDTIPPPREGRSRRNDARRGLAPSAGYLPSALPPHPQTHGCWGWGSGGSSVAEAAGLGAGGTRKVSRQGGPGRAQDDWPPSPASAPGGQGVGALPSLARALGCVAHLPLSCPQVCLLCASVSPHTPASICLSASFPGTVNLPSSLPLFYNSLCVCVCVIFLPDPFSLFIQHCFSLPVSARLL